LSLANASMNSPVPRDSADLDKTPVLYSQDLT
jgi:hypothetical protein